MSLRRNALIALGLVVAVPAVWIGWSAWSLRAEISGREDAVIADAGTATGITIVDLDLAEVAQARRRVPSLAHDRPYDGPA